MRLFSLLLLLLACSAARAQEAAEALKHLLPGHEEHQSHEHIYHQWWNFTLQPHMLERGLTYRGTGEALRRFVAKLQSGKSITLSALGGSVTRGHGGGPESMNAEKGFPGSWSRHVFDFIQKRWPQQKHVYYNGAVPGAVAARASFGVSRDGSATGAYYFVNCLSRHVHPAADIVLIEFAVNGASIKDTEGIVRRIMQAHGGLNYDPLIVFVNFWNNWPGRNDTYALNPWRSLIDQNDNESHITVVATYYDCICLSMRYAYIFEDLHNVAGFSYEDYINGGNHPNERGHRMMADLLINQLLRQSFSRSSLSDTPLVPAVYKGWLPPPIVDDNRSEEAQQMCSFGKELTASIVSNEGWTFDESVEKPGMWANSSAARLTLALKVIPPAEALKVFHLQSWVADMGTATVECVSSSCSCSQTLLNGKGGSHSIMVPTDVPFQISGAGECKLLLQGKTGSFKLMGVALAQLTHNFEGAGFEGGA